jgi:hypothetical protein
MPVANLNNLLSLCKVEDIPACSKGIRLAANFLTACGRAVELIDLEEVTMLRADFESHFNLFSSHHAECTKCQEMMT